MRLLFNRCHGENRGYSLSSRTSRQRPRQLACQCADTGQSLLNESFFCLEENNVRAGYLAKPVSARLDSSAKNSDTSIGVGGGKPKANLRFRLNLGQLLVIRS
jgi:hypothetical protein